LRDIVKFVANISFTGKSLQIDGFRISSIGYNQDVTCKVEVNVEGDVEGDLRGFQAGGLREDIGRVLRDDYKRSGMGNQC